MTDRSNVAELIRDQPMWQVGESWATVDKDGDIEFETDRQLVYGNVFPTEAKSLAAALLAAAMVAERKEQA
jgi:hypothetical protein